MWFQMILNFWEGGRCGGHKSQNLGMLAWKGLLGSCSSHFCYLVLPVGKPKLKEFLMLPGRCSSLLKVTQPGPSQICSPSTISVRLWFCDQSLAALLAAGLPFWKSEPHPPPTPFLTALQFFEFRMYTLQHWFAQPLGTRSFLIKNTSPRASGA